MDHDLRIMHAMTKLAPATMADIQVLLRLMEDFNAIYDYPFDRREREALLHTFLGDPGLGRVWMVHRNDAVAGYIILAFGFSFEHGGRDAFIDELHLEAGHRGQGVGSKVLSEVIRVACDLGIRTLHLEVEEHNVAGHHLYHRQGFQFQGRRLLSRALHATNVLPSDHP